MSAPVQIVVIGLHEPTFTGEVLEVLGRLQEAGIVRLVDVLVVTHAADGSFTTMDLPAHVPAGLGKVASAFLDQTSAGPVADGRSSNAAAGADAETADTWSLADVVPAGTTAAVALLEHLWAAPLRTAIERGGGTPLEESWLSTNDLKILDGLRQAGAAKT